jgi:hypothetical protein
MSSLINLEIKQSQIDAIAKNFAAQEKHINLALQRTIRKLSRWAITHLAREISKETKLPNAVIKKRIKSFFSPDRKSSKIWLGLEPVSAMHLAPKQVPTGVSAKGNIFKGAFIAKGVHGRAQVFKRLGKDRLPLQKQTISIEKDADMTIELVVLPQIQNRFNKLFTEELRWSSKSQV